MRVAEAKKPTEAPAVQPTITLSEDAERRLVFWASPPDSVHPVAVVAAVTDLTVSGLSNLRVTGEGPKYIKRGGRVYYRQADVVAWMRGT